MGSTHPDAYVPNFLGAKGMPVDTLTAPFRLLKHSWQAALVELVASAQQDLLLVSPFIKVVKAREIVSILETRGMTRSIRVTVLTNLQPEAALAGAMDIEAFDHFATSLAHFELAHLPSLHAKVYVADMARVIITSGNLTEAGVSRNVEYGVVSTHRRVVAAVRRDFTEYAALGARITNEDLRELLQAVGELKAAYREAETAIRSRARHELRERLDQTRLALLRPRARGRTTQSLLAETILFLLRRGPLTTAELNPLIQRVHPDLCDDSIDRVIDGVHFGKRWKHYVRTAQQALKRRGAIRLQDGLWYASPQRS